MKVTVSLQYTHKTNTPTSLNTCQVKTQHIFFLPSMHSCSLFTSILQHLHVSFIIVFLRSPGQHPVPAQSELHPAPALQGGHFQCWLSQRNLSPHPGAAGSAAAPNLADGGWRCRHRGLGGQIWVAVTRRGSWLGHPGLEDHPAAFQPGGCLFRQVEPENLIILRKCTIIAPCKILMVAQQCVLRLHVSSWYWIYIFKYLNFYYQYRNVVQIGLLSLWNSCIMFCILWALSFRCELSVYFSRIGLDWACTVADILHSLNDCPEWSTVIAAFTDHCIQQLPKTLKRTNLFTLLVLVGFPEVRATHLAVWICLLFFWARSWLLLCVCQVLCVGTQTVFIDNANEQHNMILLKHFTEKNHAAVVDVKTRKRKTGGFSCSTANSLACVLQHMWH